MAHAPAAAERLTRDELLGLVYELLDAHDDTTRLAADLAETEPRWRIQLDYLRDLQRVGRGLLARAAAESDAALDDLALHAARAAVQRTAGQSWLTISSSLELSH